MHQDTQDWQITCTSGRETKNCQTLSILETENFIKKFNFFGNWKICVLYQKAMKTNLYDPVNEGGTVNLTNETLIVKSIIRLY